MVFTVQDYADLVRLLSEHPEWQSELRRLLLSEDFLALPRIVRDLAEAQRRSEERLTRVEDSLAALAEAQRRTEERVAALAEAQQRSEERLARVEDSLAALAEAQRRSEERLARVEDSLAALAEAQRRSEERLARVEDSLAALAEAQRRTEERLTALAEAQRRSEERLTRVEDSLAALAEAQRRTEERVAALTEAQQRSEERLTRVEQRLDWLTDAVGDLRGHSLEQIYRERAVAYFGSFLRRPRVVTRETLEELLEAHLSFEEANDVLLLDLVVRGYPRRHPDEPDVWLAVEVSAVVDREDVARALRRATLLRRAGYRAIPVVAGERATQGAEEEAHLHNVVLMQDGRSSLWEEAEAAWITPRE
jgi:septal ring factor EnvC (AmiA/AmiB activator)